MSCISIVLRIGAGTGVLVASGGTNSSSVATASTLPATVGCVSSTGATAAGVPAARPAAPEGAAAADAKYLRPCACLFQIAAFPGIHPGF